jgi:hypothetical protein
MNLRKALRGLVGATAPGARWLALRDLSSSGHLVESGWFRTRRDWMPVDAQGEPVPWYTYPAIAFLAGRVQPTMAVFEYGSGNSTLWWSRRVARVVSCEHDAEWFARMRDKLPANVDYELASIEAGGDYPQRIGRSGTRFDVAVIDGRRRVDCALHTPQALAPEGVVVWDNSDRSEYAEGYAHLASLGFRRLDFWGMGPINTYAWCTSVFYREGNCLGL